MKNGARYKVKTRYGWFSLDEGSYQDYLKGRLWINWPPEKKPGEVQEALPPKASKQALELRELADRKGWDEAIAQTGLRQSAPLPFVDRLTSLSIDELDLTVRSSNGLMRAGINTLGKLKDRLESEGGILTIRNLGAKSAKEIRDVFCYACYDHLLPYEKAQYWQSVVDNHLAT